jgi:hypothetical protein
MKILLKKLKNAFRLRYFIEHYKIQIFNVGNYKITEHDELPTTACDGCIKKIRDWSSFKEICHRSSKVLLELMQKKAKCSGKDKSRRFEDKYSFLEEDSNSEDVKYLLVVEDEKQEFYENGGKFELPENVYTCDICSKQFNNCLEHLDHQSVHNGQPVFKCDKCPEVRID